MSATLQLQTGQQQLTLWYRKYATFVLEPLSSVVFEQSQLLDLVQPPLGRQLKLTVPVCVPIFQVDFLCHSKLALLTKTLSTVNLQRWWSMIISLNQDCGVPSDYWLRGWFAAAVFYCYKWLFWGKSCQSSSYSARLSIIWSQLLVKSG